MQKMKEIPFIIPSAEEKTEIVQYIKEGQAKIDNSISKLKEQVEFMREYSTRLISDVVTGQMDVRGIDIPDYTPEEGTELPDENDENEDTMREEGESDV